MKNIKVSAKLIVSFMIVIVLTAAIGGVGIIGMLQIADSGSYMYENLTAPLPYLARAEQTLLVIRIHVREMVFALLMGDFAQVETEFGAIERLLPVMDRYMDEFRGRVVNPEAIRLFGEARALYENELVPVVVSIYEASGTADIPTVLSAMELCRQYSDWILDYFRQCFDLMVFEAQTGAIYASSLASTLFIAIICVLVVVLAVSLFLALYISGLISKPLAVYDKWMEATGKNGHIVYTPQEFGILKEYKNRRDEIGTLFSSLENLLDYMNETCNELKLVADGNLNFDVMIRSDKDMLSQTLQKTIDGLNSMFDKIRAASYQVSANSQQIADDSQILAQASTEQAATIQQLSDSATEIAEKTKANAEMAAKASELAFTIKGNAEKGSKQMDEMVAAVNEINQASQSISKVIKVIEDIAFQTNILALNAAVEAARAGAHGKGFAVVADEVRSLAAKSTEAAKDTDALISDSMEKARYGAQIATEVAESLVEIVSGINKSSEIIDRIAVASDGQSVGIAQINNSITQVSGVVQRNSATAEESAAAAEELSGQSEILKDLIAQFKLKSTATEEHNVRVAKPLDTSCFALSMGSDSNY